MYDELRVYNDYMNLIDLNKTLDTIINISKNKEFDGNVYFGEFTRNKYNVVMTEVFIETEETDKPMLCFRQIYRVPLKNIDVKNIFLDEKWKTFEYIYRYEDDYTKKFFLETVARMDKKDLVSKINNFIENQLIEDKVFLKRLLDEYKENLRSNNKLSMF